MIINYKLQEEKEIKEIDYIFSQNAKILQLYSDLLTTNANIITKTLINNIINNNIIITDEVAFRLLICGIYNLDYQKDRKFIDKYINSYLIKLSKDDYINNPYYKSIKINHIKNKHWTYITEEYLPYQAIVYNDYVIDGYYEIPRIGFFDQKFAYPALQENNNSWMMITPNEIATMEDVIFKVSGHVLTLGLGMGYFAYMASLKENVDEVVIIERDKEVIELFKKNILPQFSNASKIKIIQDDAFSYMEKCVINYDYVFVDLWHDVSDGVELYLKTKKYESKFPNSNFQYWIETSLLSFIRYSMYIYLYDQLEKNEKQYQNKVIEKIKKYMEHENIQTIADFKYWLEYSTIKKMIKEF